MNDHVQELFVRRAALAVCLVIGLKTMVGAYLYGAAALPFSPTVLLRVIFGMYGDVPWAWLIYAICLGLYTWTGLWQPPASIMMRLVGMLAQAVLAVLLDERLLILVAVEAVLWLPRRQAWTGLAGLMIMTVVLHVVRWGGMVLPAAEFQCELGSANLVSLAVPWVAPTLTEAMLDAGMVLGSQVLAFGFGFLGVSERHRRLELDAARAQLLATQQLLADTARAAERTRVARELHDAIGHHLMALNLHLDLALRRAGNDHVPTSVREAKGLTQDLLATIRRVVRHEQSGQGEAFSPQIERGHDDSCGCGG